MVFYHTLDPVLFSLFGLEIRYYGLMYAFSFVIVYLMLKWSAKRKELDWTDKDIDSFMIAAVVLMIIFARLFYVIFYGFSYFINNPLEIFFIWHGGLSFHGGLLGIVLAGIWFSKKKKISPLLLGDMLALPFALAQALVRVGGNWINGELFGRITDVSWGVNFAGEVDASGNSVFRHPSQLYEGAKNILIFIILFPLKDKEWKQGTIFALFLMLYAVFRFTIEFYRQPELYVGFLTMGQFLSLFVFLAGVGILIYNRINHTSQKYKENIKKD